MKIYWSSLQTARHERELNIFQSGSIKLSQKSCNYRWCFFSFTQLVSRKATWDFPSLFTPTHTVFKQGFLSNVFQSQVI